MKQLLIIITTIFCSNQLLAQTTGQYNALNITGTSNTLKTEIPLALPSIIGSTYLEEVWQIAEIVLKSGNVIQGLPLKIEIEQGNVEIQYNGETKFLNLNAVDYINYNDIKTGAKSVIRSANQFTIDGTPLKGIVKVEEYVGQYKVVKHFYIEFLQANYNVAMDVGSKDHRKVKKENLYISNNNKLILVKGSSKKIAEQLGADKEKALRIIKENKLKLTNEEDLINFIRLIQG